MHSGSLAPLDWRGVAAGLVFVFLVRPAAGMLSLVGSAHPARERAAISFFGIRGLGSFYYLAHALNQAPFAGGEELWAVLGFTVLLSILLVAVLGSGLHSVILAIVVIDWTRFARVVRAETLQQARLEYVEAATALGMGRMTILWREILPNVLPVVLVLLSLEMGIAVIVEAILSFVGLSVSTDTPTWGGMIAEGRQIIYQAWWVLVFPLLTLFLTVLAFNQLGDGLRQWLDPMLKR